MAHLIEMQTFIRVLSRGSFVAAASDLRVSPASVTRRISTLEESLGVKLLSRNTRRVTPTEAGKRYFRFAERILSEIKREELAIRCSTDEIEGSLRILVSKSFGNLLMGQAVADFMVEFPMIRITIVVSDVSLASLDPIDGGFDLAIRLGDLRDSGLFGRTIGSVRWLVCAAPVYLERSGCPVTPGDLTEHSCIIHQTYLPDGRWKFSGPKATSVQVIGHATTNSVIIARDLALKGLGVTLLPLYCARDELASGRLVEILPSYSLAKQTVKAVYPHSRLQPRKVKAFIDFLQRRFRNRFN